jgi:hypothetical protein
MNDAPQVQFAYPRQPGKWNIAINWSGGVEAYQKAEMLAGLQQDANQPTPPNRSAKIPHRPAQFQCRIELEATFGA